MQGIWRLSVALSGTSFTDSAIVAQIVFQFIFVGGVIFGIWYLPPKAERIRNGYESIRYSAYFLVV
jgi:hypothetical protein